MRNTTLLIAVVLIGILLPRPAVAGPAYYNTGRTYGAYVGMVSPRTDYYAGRTVYFYNTSNNYRYRGTYFPLGAHVTRANYGYAPSDTVEILRWNTPTTVLVQTYNSYDNNGPRALYEVSPTGYTRFTGYENLTNANQNLVATDVPSEWDYLDASERCAGFADGMCRGEVEGTQDNYPLTFQSYNLPVNTVRGYDWHADQVLPFTYVVPDFQHPDQNLYYVQGPMYNRFGMALGDTHPVMQWYQNQRY